MLTSCADPGEQSANSGGDDPRVIRFVKDPEMAPVVEARDINGNAVSTANWKGKVVIVNFWATWCPPCREEIPALISLQEKYKDRLYDGEIAYDTCGQIAADTLGMIEFVRVAAAEHLRRELYDDDD